MPGFATPRRHLLTVGLEDYFHVGAFNQLIQRGQWYRFERRVAQGTEATLALLAEFDVRATFFVLGWIADEMPELVRTVAERGHEIASRGYYHRGIGAMTREEFRDDLERSRDALERAAAREVLGYRVADGWFGPDDLWALDVLAESGYLYDSSVAPLFRTFAREPQRRFAWLHPTEHGELWEFPISTARVLGLDVPIAGGNWFRQLPAPLLHYAVRHWDEAISAPFVMYFHTWELDPAQPKIASAPWLQRVRQYRRLERMPEILRHYLSRYRFGSVAEHLGVQPATLARTEYDPPVPVRPEAAGRAAPAGSHPARTPVTVVVPCYNEELTLPYLANTLREVGRSLDEAYDLRYVFVDDASTDATWEALGRIFADRPDCRLLRHERNAGVAAAILTGLRAADTEIVCSIDCDCTYDPHELGAMIPLLGDADMVTASPYHPEGTVRNVPGWRLVLSRTLSRLYRRVLHHSLHTYTSCFRVYRRRAMLGLRVEEGGFLGVAEMLGRLDLSGGHIVEYPTTLEVRMLGRSKMKVLRTIWGHLRLLARLAAARAAGRPAPPPEAPRPAPARRPSRPFAVPSDHGR